jgi:glyoxylate/hydroxypyruvate reductase
MAEQKTFNILIASWLVPEHVETIRRVDPRLNVIHEPDLLRKPRYAADHNGHPVPRAPEDEARWRALLAKADILFDFDYTNDQELPDLAPNVRWIHASSAGIGQFVVRRDYHKRMPRTIFTTARGVHATPLAEFCLMAILGFSRGLFLMTSLQARKKWERFAATDVRERTLVIYGLGSIGRETARLARAFGMRVIGVKRTVEGETPEEHQVDELVASARFDDVLSRAEFLVLVAPHTNETEGVLGRPRIARLPKGAVVINIGRGALIDEPAMIEALQNGHLGGAALDVFATEPLPTDSPLWTMPNVLVSPHSASTSDRENGRLTELFCRNLRAYLDGRPMENVLDVARMY